MSDQPGETPSTAQSAATEANSTAQVAEETFDAKRAMALIEKLRAEVKELRPKAKQAEELSAAQKAKAEAEMTEVQKLSARLAETETALKSERRTAQMSEIASRLGLPPALAKRLQGETPEEIEADAKALLETLPKPAKPGPGIIPNPGSNATTGPTDDQLRGILRGNIGNMFDAAANVKAGGGWRITE